MNTSKIIKGVVGGGRYTVTAPIIKEDYGLYLQIEGIELPETYEVDFSNDEHSGTSVTMIGNADGVLIPSQFIKSGKDVFAFLYHVGDEYGRTVYKFRIPNKLRPDRTDEEPTPEQQSTIDQAISALNTAVEKTAQDVIDADASAQSAKADADRAEQARDTAGEYANDAESHAQSAQESAQASERSAQSAKDNADKAEYEKNLAQGYARDAEQAKTDAQNFAVESERSADASELSASQSAQIKADVEDFASDAQDSANASERSAINSANSANQASGYAQTASEKASESAQSASLASGYAQTAESAKTDAQTAQGLAEQAKADAISAKTDAESARDDAQNIVDGISAKAEQIEEDIYKPYVTDTASGSIASFPDGADGIPLKSLVVDIDPVQDLSQGDPSPENICPISGWEGMDVNATGINIWDEEWESGDYRTTVGYGGKCTNAARIRCKNFISVKPNEALYCVSPVSKVNFVVLFYDENKVYGSGADRYTTAGTSVITVPSWAYWMTFYLVKTTYDNDISINYPSTDHDYHTYQGATIPISWQTEAGTVYGGKLDVLSGKLRVTHSYAKLVTTGWSLSGSNFWHSMTAMSNTRPAQVGWCTHYKNEVTAKGDNTIIFGYSSFSSAPRIIVRDSRFTTASDFMEFLEEQETNGTPVMIAYPLAEPIIIQLTPHEVNSLLGQNNIWADTGDTTAEYRADTTLYIQRLTEPDADMIADANIVSGQYFMVGNDLYKATVNIASGAQVIEGTNATKVSLSEALNQIKEA